MGRWSPRRGSDVQSSLERKGPRCITRSTSRSKHGRRRLTCPQQRSPAYGLFAGSRSSANIRRILLFNFSCMRRAITDPPPSRIACRKGTNLPIESRSSSRCRYLLFGANGNRLNIPVQRRMLRITSAHRVELMVMNRAQFNVRPRKPRPIVPIMSSRRSKRVVRIILIAISDLRVTARRKPVAIHVSS